MMPVALTSLVAVPVARRARHEIVADLDSAIRRKDAATAEARWLAAKPGAAAGAWSNVACDLERDLLELRRLRALVGP